MLHLIVGRSFNTPLRLVLNFSVRALQRCERLEKGFECTTIRMLGLLIDRRFA